MGMDLKHLTPVFVTRKLFAVCIDSTQIFYSLQVTVGTDKPGEAEHFSVELYCLCHLQ